MLQTVWVCIGFARLSWYKLLKPFQAAIVDTSGGVGKCCTFWVMLNRILIGKTETSLFFKFRYFEKGTSHLSAPPKKTHFPPNREARAKARELPDHVYQKWKFLKSAEDFRMTGPGAKKRRNRRKRRRRKRRRRVTWWIKRYKRGHHLSFLFDVVWFLFDDVWFFFVCSLGSNDLLEVHKLPR